MALYHKTVIFWPWYGESLAAGAAPAILTEPILPDRYFMFDDGYGVKGLHNGLGTANTVLTASGFIPENAKTLIPAVEGSDAWSLRSGSAQECPISAAVAFHDHLLQAHKLPRQVYIGRGHAQAGSAIADLMPGTIAWCNGVGERARAKELVAMRGLKLIVPAVHFTQGANDRGSTRPSRYLRILEVLAEAYLSSLGAEGIAGELPKFYIDQFAAAQNNGPEGTGARSIAIAQRNLARRNDKIACVLPKYFLKLQSGHGQVHITSESTQILGEYHALARFMDEYPCLMGKFSPCDLLKDDGLLIEGRVIKLRFHLPEGGELFVNNSIPLAQHYGFTYSDDKKSIHIDHVEISGRDSVKIILTEAPSVVDRPVISYAYAGGPGNIDGWPGTWGNIFSRSATRSLQYPGTLLHHAALSFSIPVERG